ncbi:MAG: hypothetical protein NTY53_23695 [Kiritimatiellaeota bacterium]|nr:hypothetical protein [Kiritimatiellota bacterium]
MPVAVGNEDSAGTCRPKTFRHKPGGFAGQRFVLNGGEDERESFFRSIDADEISQPRLESVAGNLRQQFAALIKKHRGQVVAEIIVEEKLSAPV